MDAVHDMARPDKVLPLVRKVRLMPIAAYTFIYFSFCYSIFSRS